MVTGLFFLKTMLLIFLLRTVYQYSFVGPLSLSKGCDYAIPLNRTNLDPTQDVSPLFDYAYRGRENIRDETYFFLQERTLQ